MVVFFLNKILLITYFMCVGNCAKHIWGMLNLLRQELPSKYLISKSDRFLLGFSISYIITTLITGITL